MGERFVSIRGIDPLLFRDARPFTAELGALNAQTLPLPYPGTVAGFLRTQLGNRERWKWKEDGPEKALATPIAGPILQCNGKTAFASPSDVVIYEDELKKEHLMPLRPWLSNQDSNLPEGLVPVAVTEEGKPVSGYDYWTWENVAQWLQSPAGVGFPLPTRLGKPLRDTRTHVAIESATGISAEGMLFSTQSLCFERHPAWSEKLHDKTIEDQEWSLLARVETEAELSGVGQFGGERRLASVLPVSAEQWPACPPDLTKAVAVSKRVRLQLATPALFEGGWHPKWSGEALTWSPPGTGVTLKLVSAAVRRREPVSGWDYKINGPKPVRWMVPAGSVYFFEVIGGEPEALIGPKTWLAPISDEEQDRKDGYGLALWGIWDTEEGTA